MMVVPPFLNKLDNYSHYFGNISHIYNAIPFRIDTGVAVTSPGINRFTLAASWLCTKP
jgi:hypothetical protein